VQAAIYIASQPAGQLVSIHTIAENLNISFHFLTKVLQQLTAAGIMTSQRGVNGGVMLAKPADEVTLYDVISTIDGSDLFTQCLLGLPGCGSAEPCPVHDQWTKLRTQIALVFTKNTLGSLGETANRLNLRLAHPELIVVLHL